LLTIKDFKFFCRQEGIRLLRQINLGLDHRANLLANAMPNLFAESVIFVLQNGGQSVVKR